MHFVLRLYICRFLCTASLLAQTNLEKPDPEAAGLNAQRLSAIRARMQAFVEAGQTAGTVTLVARHGKVASFEAVGYQDVETKKPMQKDSLFRIASLTKPITCAGIMVLVDEGRLSVIDPVERYLPEYKGIRIRGCEGSAGHGCVAALPSRPIDIEDLMVHTSGLESDVHPIPGTEATMLADLTALGSHTQLLFEPGTRWNYSNLGYDILGRIIEIVSHQPYDVFLKQRLFDPLGMRDTFFVIPDQKQNRLATLYTLSDAGLKRSQAQYGEPHPPKIPMPAGGLISTAEDIFRFNMMMRNKGTLDGRRVLSSAAVTLMTTSHTGDMKAGWVPGVGHGYGYEVVRNAEGMFRYNSIGTIVKGGAYRTYEWVDPEKDLVGVFMMQLTNGGGDTADEINSFMAISAASIE